MKIDITWGTTKSWEITATDENDDPVDLTGKTLLFMAKRKYADLDTAAIFTLTNAAGITAPGENGDNTAIIKISPDDTEALTRSTTTALRYQLLLVDGTDRFELQSGVLSVEPSVTEA